MDTTRTNWPELVRALCSCLTTDGVATRLEVRDRTVRRWKSGQIEPQGKVAYRLLEECEKVGINWRHYSGLMPIYDVNKSFAANAANGPQGIPRIAPSAIPKIPTSVFGRILSSPIGVPASVLTLNARWISALLPLGYDVITAKTRRSHPEKPHPFPNILYLANPPLPADLKAALRATPDLPTQEASTASFANSFGIPSEDPKDWQQDLREALRVVGPNQLLLASVVGSGSKPEELVKDFVKAARLAREVGPHGIELNLCCPNVYGPEGSIFHDPGLAAEICRRVRKEINDCPLIAKIGALSTRDLKLFFESTYKFLDGISAINSIQAPVFLDGQREEHAFGTRKVAGISGRVIRERGVAIVGSLRQLAENTKKELVIFGMGGIGDLDSAQAYLDAGATCVQACTAVLLNPMLAVDIRRGLTQQSAHGARSALLAKAGIHVPFADPTTAEAFDNLFRACEKEGVVFERGFEVFNRKWLSPYRADIERSELDTSKVRRARRSPAPSFSDIASWIRNEFSKF